MTLKRANCKLWTLYIIRFCFKFLFDVSFRKIFIYQRFSHLPFQKKEKRKEKKSLSMIQNKQLVFFYSAVEIVPLTFGVFREPSVKITRAWLRLFLSYMYVSCHLYVHTYRSNRNLFAAFSRDGKNGFRVLYLVYDQFPLSFLFPLRLIY